MPIKTIKKGITQIISLDGVIFVILALRLLLSVHEKAPNPIFYTVILFCIFIYLIVDNYYQLRKTSNVLKLKKITFFGIIFILICLPALFLIIQRQVSHNNQNIVDSSIVSEQAAKYLLSGINPYVASYETVLKDWPFKVEDITFNSAVYHYPYLPFYTAINSLAFLLFSKLFGFFDLRMMSLIILIPTVFLIFRLTKSESNKFLFTTLILFNPLFLTSFFWGYNDIYIFFFVLLIIYFLGKNKLFLAISFLALVSGIKHSAWPLIPFVFTFIFLNKRGNYLQKLTYSLKRFLPFFLIVLVIFLPSILGNFKAFWEDIWLYPQGGLPTSAPMQIFGFSELLIYFGVIKSRLSNFPFFIYQIIFVFPLFLYLIHLQKKNNSSGQILFNYGILLLVSWYFSRILHYNYLAYVSLVLTAAFFISSDTAQRA